MLHSWIDPVATLKTWFWSITGCRTDAKNTVNWQMSIKPSICAWDETAKIIKHLPLPTPSFENKIPLEDDPVRQQQLALWMYKSNPNRYNVFQAVEGYFLIAKPSLEWLLQGLSRSHLYLSFKRLCTSPQLVKKTNKNIILATMWKRNENTS